MCELCPGVFINIKTIGNLQEIVQETRNCFWFVYVLQQHVSSVLEINTLCFMCV